MNVNMTDSFFTYQNIIVWAILCILTNKKIKLFSMKLNTSERSERFLFDFSLVMLILSIAYCILELFIGVEK